MLRFPLHPTSGGFFLGLGAIALWALLWLWFLFGLGEGRSRLSANRAATPLAANATQDRGQARFARGHAGAVRVQPAAKPGRDE